MSDNVVELAIKMTDGVTKPLQDIKTALDETKAASLNMGEALKFAGECFEKLKEYATEFISLELAKEFIKTASAIEDLKVQLTNTTGSQEKANEKFEEFEKVISTSALKLSDLVNAHKILKLDGIDITTESLKAMGEAALATGKGSAGMVAIAEAIGHINIMGGVSTRTIRELTNAGINAVEIFKDVDITTLSASSAITMILDNLNAKSKDNADITKDTWSSMLSEISNTWEIMQSKLMNDGMFKNLENSLHLLLDSFKRFLDSQVFAHFASDFNKMSSKLPDGINLILELVNAMGKLYEVTKLTNDIGKGILLTPFQKLFGQKADVNWGTLQTDLDDVLDNAEEKEENNAETETKKDKISERKEEITEQEDLNKLLKQKNDLVLHLNLDNIKSESDLLKDQVRESEEVVKSWEKQKEVAVKNLQEIQKEQQKVIDWNKSLQQSLDSMLHELDNKGKKPEEVEKNNEDALRQQMNVASVAIQTARTPEELKNAQDQISISKDLLSGINDETVKREAINNLKRMGNVLAEKEKENAKEKSDQLNKDIDTYDKWINNVKTAMADIQLRIESLKKSAATIELKIKTDDALNKIAEVQQKIDALNGDTSKKAEGSSVETVSAEKTSTISQASIETKQTSTKNQDEIQQNAPVTQEQEVNMKKQLIKQGYNVIYKEEDYPYLMQPMAKETSTDPNRKVYSEDEYNKKLAEDNEKLAESSEKVTIAADNETKETNDAADAMKRFGEEVRHIEVKNISSNSNDEKETHASGGLVTTPKGIAGQGEYVINRSATAKYGADIFDSFNTKNFDLQAFAASSIPRPSFPNFETLSKEGFSGGQNVVNLKIGDETYSMNASENTINKLRENFGTAQRQAQRYGKEITFEEYLTKKF
ncbi:MAG: hypothetical protein HQK91_14840 [Nitrospirae bacterium]|nr:hypothetical protein [Nitrospirota bacterium]